MTAEHCMDEGSYGFDEYRRYMPVLTTSSHSLQCYGTPFEKGSLSDSNSHSRSPKNVSKRGFRASHPLSHVVRVKIAEHARRTSSQTTIRSLPRNNVSATIV